MTELAARARLIAHLQQAGLSTARAEANVDAYAHELAEEIRAQADREYGNDCTYGVGMCFGADAIDPEKQR